VRLGNILSASRLSSKPDLPFPGEKQGLEVQMAKLFRQRVVREWGLGWKKRDG
jgi:hypothetical protein